MFITSGQAQGDVGLGKQGDEAETRSRESVRRLNLGGPSPKKDGIPRKLRYYTTNKDASMLKEIGIKQI